MGKCGVEDKERTQIGRRGSRERRDRWDGVRGKGRREGETLPLLLELKMFV